MPSHPPLPPIDLSKAQVKDRFYLHKTQRKINTLRKSGQSIDTLQEKLSQNYQRSCQIVSSNLSKLPKANNRGELPVSLRWDEIKKVIDNNQVSIICGHTGSGKTTKIPQICLDLNLGACGQIAHTQPRRIAARTVSSRIAEELGVILGQEVGYKVRFDNKYSKTSRVLLMTDGILLAEIQQDKFLNQYEVIIIDEAHERSLNIDFLLGYLSKLLPKRPDLKVIITSATIDPQRFSKHFNHAPIVMVEGETFPIRTLYRPTLDDDDLYQSIRRSVLELDELHYGDTLIFLPTERDIREAADELNKLHLANTEVLSLFSRQTAAAQNAIFHPKNKRRIILATNVAETSITVPRILNVIDSGLARISRYSHRSKIQRLPIEAISQASANQRKGRCGRIAEGVCLRLYEESDFLARNEFTDPEIKRTSLASVILQMASLGIGKIENFPFVEPPEYKMIADGYKLLFELEAVDKQQQITSLGRQMAQLPTDPRFAKILLYAKQHATLDKALPIVAALAVGDIKERPFGQEIKADTQHRLFAHQQSDFLFFVNVFYRIYPLFKQSKNRANKWARQHYLSILRVREWLFLVEQFAEQLQYKLTLPSLNDDNNNDNSDNKDPHANDYQALHTTILTGFLDHVGIYQDENNDYIGVRNKRFHIFPGSFLFKKKFKQVMCAEIVESSRIFARQVAKIELEWLEQLAKHLTKTTESEPMWSKVKGNVMAKQSVLLYGLAIISNRLVPYGTRHPAGANDIFIRHGLIENAIHCKVNAIAQNRAQYDKLLRLEEKSRSRNILIDDNQFAELYFAIIPQTVYSAKTLEAWYKKTEDKAVLLFKEADFLLQDEHGVDSSNYPNHLNIHGQTLVIEYEFNPASERDGITANIPLANLNTFTTPDFDYLVPAMLVEKIEAIIRSLPKRYRRQFVPIPPYAEKISAFLNEFPKEKDKPLNQVISEQLERLTSIKLSLEHFDLAKLDKHFLMNFALMDKKDKCIAESRDLASLQAQYQDSATHNFSQNTRNIFAEVFTQEFPKKINKTHNITHKNITAYPALIQSGEGFKINLFDNEQHAQSAHELGVLAFIKAKLHKEVKYIKKNLLMVQKITLLYRALGDDTTLIDDIVDAIIINTCFTQGIPRDASGFEKIVLLANTQLIPQSQILAKDILSILENQQIIRAQLNKNRANYEDISQQLNRLIYAGFIAKTEANHIHDLVRYSKGVIIRLEKAKIDPLKDSKWQLLITPYATQLQDFLNDNKLDKFTPENIRAFGYLLEEYRLSIFAQNEVGAKEKVSPKRLDECIANITS